MLNFVAADLRYFRLVLIPLRKVWGLRSAIIWVVLSVLIILGGVLSNLTTSHHAKYSCHWHIGRGGGDARDACPSLSEIYFVFMQFSANDFQSNRLALPPGKSWIRYCLLLDFFSHIFGYIYLLMVPIIG